MQWTLLAQEADPATIGKILLAGVAILTAVNIFLSIYQKFNPKKSPGQEFVTVAVLSETKQELNGQIGSVRRKQEALDDKHHRFVTRDEVEKIMEPLVRAVDHNTTKVEELDNYIHRRDTQIQDQLNQIGKEFETGRSQILQSYARHDEKLKFLIRLWQQGKKEKDEINGSDDQPVGG